MSLSIIILARDEAQDLPRLLESIRWCHDIHLVDSGSSDATVEIARAAGAHCLEHFFAAFGQQRNWALDNCALKHPWVLFLDADEASTPEFQASVLSAIATADESIAGFYCCWKMMVEDRWLRRCDSFPKWQFRLLRRGRATFMDFGHGQKEEEIDGTLGYISEPYLHFVLSKGWASWLERHNRYSSQEAAERMRTPIRWGEILSRDPSVRNKALKPLVSQIPGWPVLRFVQAYLLSGGFLEGRPGFTYCVNLAYYEFLIQAKQREPALPGAAATGGFRDRLAAAAPRDGGLVRWPDQAFALCLSHAGYATGRGGWFGNVARRLVYQGALCARSFRLSKRGARLGNHARDAGEIPPQRHPGREADLLFPIRSR